METDPSSLQRLIAQAVGRMAAHQDTVDRQKVVIARLNETGGDTTDAVALLVEQFRQAVAALEEDLTAIEAEFRSTQKANETTLAPDER